MSRIKNEIYRSYPQIIEYIIFEKIIYKDKLFKYKNDIIIGCSDYGKK